jgi:rare lipoprotein A
MHCQWGYGLMPWNNRAYVVAFAAALTSNAALAQSGRDAIERLPPAAMDGRIMGGDRDPASSPDGNAVPQDKVSYDEVGYASWYGPDRAGTPLASGEIFDAAAVSAAHASLPVPSYAEVTDLRTGRTILVRVNDNGPPPKGQIIALSLGAARQLGVETEGAFPARVRRTNPPEFERIALQGGGTATERLATPPALLNALRKRIAAAPVAPLAAKPMTAKPLPKRPAPKASPEPVVAPAPIQSAVQDGRFIEENVRPHWDPVLVKKAAKAPAKPVPSRVSPTPVASVGSWYLQVAAFSTEARARAAASRVGGGVVRAGSIYRVRTGPYQSEAAARAAVGAMAAKGYPGARPTR